MGGNGGERSVLASRCKLTGGLFEDAEYIAGVIGESE